MHSFKYARYFFYLAFNWNMRIAWHIVVQEMKGEKKYDIDTTGFDELSNLEKNGIDISHATMYMPASYDLMANLFGKLEGKALSHFLDIGCGKGRAMVVAAHHGFQHVTGIDFSEKLCKAAIINVEHTKTRFPLLKCQVINNDAFYYKIPKDTDCIFLFNPFDATIMSAVLKNIESHRISSIKDIYIIYINPIHKDLFINTGYKEFFYTKKLHYLEGCILKK